MSIRIRGRRSILDDKMKAEICDRVNRGDTVVEAAEAVDVSLRTVQRAAVRDENFHHELKLALGGAPDPLKLMQTAARAHWRAAAWLLERQDPEHYAKRPASAARPDQVEAALAFVLEAALETVDPQQRTSAYEHVQAACDHAFKCVFPAYGPWGRSLRPQLPPTPLVDQEQLNQIRNPPKRLQVPDEPIELLPPPKSQFAARVNFHALLAIRGQGSAQAALSEGVNGDDSTHTPSVPSANLPSPPILSPKTRFATEFIADEDPPAA